MKRLKVRLKNDDMLIDNKDNTISFSIFSEFPQVYAVMTTRKVGNANLARRLRQNTFTLPKQIKTTSAHLVLMEQVHGAHVAPIGPNDAGNTTSGVDGLVGGGVNYYLAVNTADCVPLFFFDPRTGLVGVAHAGWRGTLGAITSNMLTQMKTLGALPTSIRVAMGPHIGACCYNVASDRYDQFKAQFNNEGVAFISEGKMYVDLALANRLQLISAGIEPAHIDAPITCTSCQNDIYFSYRKDLKENFGEMLGIIGVKG